MLSSRKGLRIIFAGTPPVAATCLEMVLGSSHSVVQVYTQPDRPAGRGLKVNASAVKRLAMEHHLPLAQPETMKNINIQKELKALKADVMVVVAYGLLLPKSLLTIPPLGCLNVHLSLLPRWRGAAPVERALLAGDRETGVSVMEMDEGLDTGKVLLRIPCPIAATDTSAILYDRLAQLGGKALLQGLEQLGEDPLEFKMQDHTQATYAKKIKKEEALISWDSSAVQIHRMIRAFNPRPVAFTFLGETRLRIWEANVSPHKPSRTPGTLIEVNNAGLYVATGDGTVQITQCQLPGGKVQPVSKLLHGFSELFVEGVQFFNKAQSTS